MCHTRQLSHFLAWAALCLNNNMIVHARTCVCKQQIYTCIPNNLFWIKGKQDQREGNSKPFCVNFVTYSIKPSFTKWHLHLPAVNYLKCKDLIYRTQTQNIYTLVIPSSHDTKQNLRVLILLLNTPRPFTPVVPTRCYAQSKPVHRALTAASVGGCRS